MHYNVEVYASIAFPLSTLIIDFIVVGSLTWYRWLMMYTFFKLPLVIVAVLIFEVVLCNPSLLFH